MEIEGEFVIGMFSLAYKTMTSKICKKFFLIKLKCKCWDLLTRP